VPCSLVDIYQHFRGICYLSQCVYMVNEAAGSNRISVFLFQTAWPGLAVGVCELDSLPHHLTLRGLLTNVGISQIIVFHCFGLY